MKQGYGIEQFYGKKTKTLDFTDEWLALIGKPEVKGSWFIWGNSGNGKTIFSVKLAKYLSTFGRVLYNSLEEGLSASLKRAFKLAEVSGKDKITLLDKEPMNELAERLRKRKSPKFIIIDSFQYTGLNAMTYKQLTNEFSNKLFIFVSHADGKQPSGRTAKTVHYDANVKIWIDGFKAFSKSRYGGTEPLTIWEEGAKKYWVNE
ncbi:MAG: hypothetical protein L3J56_06310 [Bacteroidales bacterium]|nr:hypothetical protein [Bacteroidales bacterium]